MSFTSDYVINVDDIINAPPVNGENRVINFTSSYGEMY